VHEENRTWGLVRLGKTTERTGKMKKCIKKSIAIISLLVGGSSAWAALITDNFNRENMTQTQNTVNVGGTGWTQAGDGTAAGSDWFIAANVARLRDRNPNAVMYNTALSTVSGGGTNFTLSADVSGRILNVWVGTVFNYQDEANYYVLRIKAGTDEYQLIERRGSVNTAIVNQKISGSFAVSSYYTLTITSDTAGDFNFTIKQQGESAVLNTVTAYDDSASALTGGYAGLYATYTGGHSGQYDNFSLSVIPEPATMGLFSVALGVILLIRKKRF